MARVTIEDCLEQVESRFSLVHLAVRRVLQLRRGAIPLVNAPKNKEVVLALREIAASKVTVESIRQLEEMEALPAATPSEKPNVVHQEVEEIVESVTRHSVPMEFEVKGETSFEEDED